MIDIRRMQRIFADINAERVRQEELREAGKFTHTCASPQGMTLAQKALVLGEEVGEVCTAVLEHDGIATAPDRGVVAAAHLRRELVQVAAVAVAWLEAIDGPY